MNSLRASNSLNRSRSARNVMARTLPILERGGSTRNFRELPPSRPSRNNLESPAAFRRGGQRRSNSTRRFFVPDQNSRGSSTATTSTNTACSLSNHFRRITLERSNSESSMGSFDNQSWGTSNSLASNRTGNNSNNEDSVLSILSIDSLSCLSGSAAPPRAPPSVLSSGIDTDLDETEGEDMMSLFSKDSVRVRHNQLDNSSTINQASYSNHSLSCRDGMSVAIADNDVDMLSLASSECTVYSFDVRPPPPMMSVLGSFHRS